MKSTNCINDENPEIHNCCTQPPYSPNLAPLDFWLFLKLKEKLKGQHFSSTVEVAVYNWIKSQPKIFFVDRMKKSIGCFEKICSTKWWLYWKMSWWRNRLTSVWYQFHYSIWLNQIKKKSFIGTGDLVSEFWREMYSLYFHSSIIILSLYLTGLEVFLIT